MTDPQPAEAVRASDRAHGSGCDDDCDQPHLTPEGRRQLIALIDREMEHIRVMRAHGWPLATPRELIPPAYLPRH